MGCRNSGGQPGARLQWRRISRGWPGAQPKWGKISRGRPRARVRQRSSGSPRVAEAKDTQEQTRTQEQTQTQETQDTQAQEFRILLGLRKLSKTWGLNNPTWGLKILGGLRKHRNRGQLRKLRNKGQLRRLGGRQTWGLHDPIRRFDPYANFQYESCTVFDIWVGPVGFHY